ncbi:hypothetical protein [Streptomyces sp. NPDC056387]|uniref:hypothetical protein n=1 Tax=Streptomyces sp. NPDC056387 TaxID=3345803 RepID=UPI0035DDC393
MTPKREIPQGTAAGDLAIFLVRLVRQATVRELAGKFGKSSATWGNYLNGAQLIPMDLLSRLVEAYTAPGQARQVKAVRANELWVAAARERRGAPSGGTLVRQHQRREDALLQVVKYQELAANAERHLAQLRPMLAYTQGRLENVQLQLNQAGEREKARIELQLSQARERLSRVQLQRERARSRRLTAEEQQEFWMREAVAAQDEINRLEREAHDLAVPEGTVASRPGPGDVTDSDTEVDIRLEHIEAEGFEDEARIKLDLDVEDVETTSAPVPQPSDDSCTLTDAQPAAETANAVVAKLHPEPSDGRANVQLLSNESLDRPSTSASTQRASVSTSSLEARGRPAAGLATIVFALGLAETSEEVAAMFFVLCGRERGQGWFWETRLTYRAFGITATRAQRAAVTFLLHGYLPASWGDLQRLLEVVKAEPEEVIAFHQAYARVPRTPSPDHESAPTSPGPFGVVRMPQPVFYMVVLAVLYAIAAGLMAGIRADPGPAIWKLAVYVVGGGLVALVLWFSATGTALYVAEIHGRGMLGANMRPLFLTVLLLGLLVSGVGVDIPGRWIADAVGLL